MYGGDEQQARLFGASYLNSQLTLRRCLKIEFQEKTAADAQGTVPSLVMTVERTAARENRRSKPTLN